MRPGPSIEQLAGAVAVGVRTDVMLGGRVVATDVEVSDVQLEATCERVVPSQISLSGSPNLVPTGFQDPLNNYGQRLHIVSLLDCLGTPFEVPVGWFQIESWEETTSGVTVKALDLMQVLEADPFAWPSSPPAGATLLSELRRLCASDVAGASLPVVLDPGVKDRKIPRTFEWGTSRTEAIRDLCGAYSLGYGVKTDGQLHVWALADETRPVATYTGQDLLVGGVRRSKPRVANRWTVAGSPQGDDGVKWTSTSTNFHGPYDPASYGVVTDRKEFNAATSAGAVVEAAQTYMKNALAARSERSFEIVLDPRLELGDVISVFVSHDDGQKEMVIGRVKALVMALDDPASVMRVDVEELSWASL